MSIYWLIALVISGFICHRLARRYQKHLRFTRAIEKIPGPPDITLPVIGNLRTVLLYKWASHGQFDDAVLVYQEIQALCKLFFKEGIYKYWLVNLPIIVILTPQYVESILSAPSETNKSQLYFAFKPWLGEGLVTSAGTKWRARRRIITPAFHFNILNEFLPAFDASATTLVRKLNNIKYQESFDVGPVVAHCTMEIICETAMGIGADFQTDEHSEWSKAVHHVTKLAVKRMMEPWLWLDELFYRSEEGRQFLKSRDYMRSVAMNVTLERKAEWEERMKTMDPKRMRDSWQAYGRVGKVAHSEGGPVTFGGTRVKMAFLDLMLYQHLVESSLSIDDVQEEVDTFMFAGQDTTAVTISWTLYMLGLHQEIQDKVRRELEETFGAQDGDEETCTDGDIIQTIKITAVTAEALAKLKYLEMVIKETLRYWPTVPNISRKLSQDLMLGGKYLVPAGCTVSVHIHALHHDPVSFPQPSKYDPERFSPENSAKRHPYAFVPFSAGPRNCVGQKFAMLEAKVILAKVLRNYRVVTTMHMDRLRIVGEVVLKTETGLPIRLEPI